MKYTKHIVFASTLLLFAACSDDKFTDVVPFPDTYEEDNNGGEDSPERGFHP